MDQNRDWRPIAALALAALALLVALGDRGSNRNDQAAVAPQPIIIQPQAPSGGTTAPVPVVPMPAPQMGTTHMWGGSGAWRGGGHMFPLLPLLFLGFLAFLAFRVLGRWRHGWGGPGWYGRQWGGPGPGPGPGPQGPPPGYAYGPYQYPPQYGQGQPQNQQYGGYPPQPQPQAEQGPQAQQSQQGQPTQAFDPHGDITRPEGSGD